MIVANTTGSTLLTLWEQDIGLLTEKRSYLLSRVHVHRFYGKSELSFPFFGATIEEIEDQQVSTYEEDEEGNIDSATIIGVNILPTPVSIVRNLPALLAP